MTDGSDWPLDLIVRARRGELSTREEGRLKQYLRSSRTLRVARLVGDDFDRVGEVEPGDDQQVQWFVAEAIRRHNNAGRSWRGPRRLVTGLLAVALLLSGTTALGWWHGWVRFGFLMAPRVAASATAQSHSTVPVDPPPRARRSTQASGAESHPEPEPESGPVDLPSPAPTKSECSPRRQRTKSRHPSSSLAESATAFEAVEPSSLSAVQLFSSANRARRAGQNARAIAMFQQLQRQFPGSAEAQLSHLSLGRVWLGQGRAQQALDQFSSYLASGGPLAEEALLGTARALAAQGRFEEERAAWQTLQRRFPSSVYQAQAEKRLRQLDAGARR